MTPWVLKVSKHSHKKEKEKTKEKLLMSEKQQHEQTDRQTFTSPNFTETP